VRLRDQPLEVADGAELVQHGVVVRDVVAAVTQRRLEERGQPEAVHPQPLQVVQPVDESGEIPGPIAVGIRESPYEYLVEHSLPVPQRIVLETWRIELERALGSEVLAGTLRIKTH
jgi:hypothetical protein